MSSNISSNISSAAEQAKDKAATTWNTVSAASAAAGHATLEKTHTAAEKYNANLAISENVDSRNRMEAAKAALEHHAAAKEHRELKELNAEFAGLPNIAGKASSAVQAIPSALSSAASTAGSYVMAGATAVYNAAVGAGHSVLGAKESLQTEMAKEKAVDESLPTAERMEAAKSALEHDLAAKSHTAAALQEAKTQ